MELDLAWNFWLKNLKDLKNILRKILFKSEDLKTAPKLKKNVLTPCCISCTESLMKINMHSNMINISFLKYAASMDRKKDHKEADWE